MKKKPPKYLDLASELIGGEVVYATDESSGSKDSLIKPKLDDRTKSSGWLPKSKSERQWAAICLGAKGLIKNITIDTSNLKSQAAKRIAVDALAFDGRVEDWQLADFLDWDEVLPETDITTNKENTFDVTVSKPYTHIRLHIYGQGGISHCSVYGEVYVDWQKLKEIQEVDLISATNGARNLAYSNAAIGTAEHLIMPKKSSDETDGWLTQSDTSGESFHWAIFKLARQGFIERIIVDTYNFYENRPKSCTIEYCISNNDLDVINDSVDWHELLPHKGLKPHRENPFLSDAIKDHEAITHIKLKLFPYGGISRLRLFGTIKK